MPVLAAMGEREASRIGEAVGRAVDDLGHHRQRPHRAGADAWNEEQSGEVGRPPIRRRREACMNARREHVARAHIVTDGHDEMRQNELLRMRRRRGLACRGLQASHLARQAVRTQGLQKLELAATRGVRPAIREVDDFALIDSSMPECG